jgi:hypothetical protein
MIAYNGCTENSNSMNFDAESTGDLEKAGIAEK